MSSLISEGFNEKSAVSLPETTAEARSKSARIRKFKIIISENPVELIFVRINKVLADISDISK
jgi:hypothetical protein